MFKTFSSAVRARVAALRVSLASLRAKLAANPVIVLFVCTFAVVIFLNAAKVDLIFWGIAKLAAFAFAGDWVDARIFPNAAPELLDGAAQGTAWKRKGLIVAAAIIAGALLP